MSLLFPIHTKLKDGSPVQLVLAGAARISNRFERSTG